MEQRARYKVNFDGKAIRASVAFMAVAFFCRTLYFFVINPIKDASVVDMIFYLILPAILELGWIVLLHIVKLNAAGIYGLVFCGICLFLAVQVGISAGIGRTVVAALVYLLCCGLALLITGGFFPYKYIGLLLLLLTGLGRFLLFDLDEFVLCRDWNGFTLEAAGLAEILAMAFFFGGIIGIPCKKK